MFWVCVPDKINFRFSKPVSITIPHFLDLENDNDAESLGLTFLKANHNKNSDGMFEFKPADGEMDFRTVKTRGTLQTLHFCSLCIAAKDIPKSLKKTRFCLTAVLPQRSIPVGVSVNAYFFVTFLNLSTCLRKVKDLITKMGLDGYRVEKKSFQFQQSNTDPALEMVVSQPQCGKIGVTGNKTVAVHTHGVVYESILYTNRCFAVMWTSL